jgi:mRNA interferase RelE/StbE
LKGKGAGDLYRIRAGDFRIIYAIDDKLLIVLVLKVGNRRDVYRS